MPIAKIDNYTPLIRTAGTGTGVVLRDGRTYQVRWSRPSGARGTTYTTTSGRRMTFHTGQVWVLPASKKPRVP